MKILVSAIICAAWTLFAAPALCEEKAADMTPILQEKLRADKKYLVATNLPLTETEANRFWPVYDAYQADLVGIDTRIAMLIVDYQVSDSTGTLNDTVAKKLAEQMLAVEDDEAQLRRRYFARFLQAIPPIKVARYLQIESKIRSAKRYEISSQIPLIDTRTPNVVIAPSSGI